ncbi:TPA: exodeoxyribonuclease III [Candidatus Saccharibacteria bacterium]|nr:exodeoxyribonuclease III [Candidatus Saccharibacteria bacterium]HIO87247.1 exodeoxyribonuclease III [Candidatus Saccharibacteria bacterium]
MHIFSWNVNGIRAVLRKDMFDPFFSTYDPDILCIQETKAQPEQVSLQIPGYQQVWNSAERKGYSGTLILSKETPKQVIPNIPLEITQKYGGTQDEYGDTNKEGRAIAAEYDQFWLATVYTPNAKDDLSRIPMRYKHWDPSFLEFMLQLEADKPVIFCGDLNVAHKPIDLARPKQNEGKKGFTKEEREGFEHFLDAGFVDTFRKFDDRPEQYSWWSAWGGARDRNVGWRIDYFLASKRLEDRLTSAKIHQNVMGSDHCPVSIELN